MVEKRVCQNIKNNDVQTIKATIDKLKQELRTLRNAKASSGSATKLAKIKVVRKNIARNLTFLNQKQRATAGEKTHKHSIKRPIFVREKLTRAYRRRLSSFQKHKQIKKVQKRALNFPMRKYGIKA